MIEEAVVTKDHQYLTDHGWRLVVQSTFKFGKIHYWDHDEHQRDDGRWWTQGDAVCHQRSLDKYNGKPKRKEPK